MNKIIKVDESMLYQAASWFSEKWGIPKDAYLESMKESFHKEGIPAWYIVLDENKIIAGIGIIENDFHERMDLYPNVCAVYVEKDYRNQGIAGKMLEHVVEESHKNGIDTIYLLTDHTSFYERYGWSFYDYVQGNGEDHKSRMYIHRKEPNK